eukprot:scaffold12637_cov33-Phaeocystis_antarctica.AAC.2
MGVQVPYYEPTQQAPLATYYEPTQQVPIYLLSMGIPGAALLTIREHARSRRAAAPSALVAPEREERWHAADWRRWCGPRAGAPRTTETGGRGVVGGVSQTFARSRTAFEILTRRYPQDTAGVLRYKWPQDAAVSSGRACFRVVFGRSYGGVIRYRTSGSRWSRDRPAGQDNECGRAEPPLAAGTGVERYCPPTRVSSRVHSARADGRASTRHLHGKTEHLIGTHTARVPAWTPLTAGARRCAERGQGRHRQPAPKLSTPRRRRRRASELPRLGQLLSLQ